MSTVYSIRNIKMPKLTRTTLIVGTLALIAVVAACVIGVHVYRKLTTTTVTAYFPEVLALYPGDAVQIMGVEVGKIDSIETSGDKMKVVFHYASKYSVPENASASVLNPSIVASRVIQLSPPYTGGPVMQDGAVIPIERTQIPIEYDELRNQLTRILDDLGPTPKQPKGPFGDVIEAFADGLQGKGEQINRTLKGLSDAVTTLNQGRGDFFQVIKSLAVFVNALHKSDQQFTALNNDLASFTNKFTNNDQELATALKSLNQLMTTTRSFLDKNGDVLAHDINDVSEATTAILQPEPRDGLERALHAYPNFLANLVNIYSPATGGLISMPISPGLTNFSNPMQFVCSSIQAGSRLGYQDSAELCAQYLGPIMDAIKFNSLPFGNNMAVTAMTLPKAVAYSEPRLQPPGGFKDTTVPGVFSRDTPWSHGQHEPGWITAPGMQGLKLGQSTQDLLTPDSLSELMGGPDIVPPTGGQNMAGPPDAYNESSPLPPPWYPQPGPVSPPLPGNNPPDPSPMGAGPAPGPAPAPAGPALPAEAGGQ
ncbi:virulence factor Mce family protein [Mycobacterium sp. OTB74]|uniref:virulence factor Mce family protein n=1 Tax=Mycobacterium sp. OTB74 TaxID=1853452 RepID=UPI0024768821|nr:virulence factor Mce family protein [Mycobacterium sp. OTB74]MDH6243459.1 phospholipid/cholesterol/gamma-HCH transport system substrate-binding protein [Mycobacterium sp. OTB74]